MTDSELDSLRAEIAELRAALEAHEQKHVDDERKFMRTVREQIGRF